MAKKKQGNHGKKDAAGKNCAGGWKYTASGKLFGTNIYDLKWEDTGRQATVIDPLYGQAHRFTVYTVEVNGKKHEIAYGEFSNSVYGLYTR